MIEATSLALGSDPPVRTVVSDTGPLNYLRLIERSDILGSLFGQVLIPEAVRRELLHPGAPAAVKAWIAHSPCWLLIHLDIGGIDPALRRLGDGECQAIRLASARKADLILMDDRAGREAARSKGFAVTGTLGVIDLAARRGLIDLVETVTRLQSTNFRCRPDVLGDLLARYRQS